MITITCDTCGIKIERGQWAIDNYKHHFCSNECKDKYLQKDKVVSYCKECNAEILNYPSRIKKFCSKKCRIKYRKTNTNTVERTCEWCGKKFTIRKDFTKGNNGRFCSRKCTGEFKKKAHGITSKCEICGKEIRYTKSNTYRYCSNECKYKGNQGELHQGWKGGLLNLKCDMCGTEYLGHRDSINNNHTFCSRKCLYEFNVGPNNPMWRGGKSFKEYPQEFNNILREQIRNRDNRTCQMCLKPEIECDTRLLIHHIDADKFNSDSLNLISLCNMCHGRINYHEDKWKEHFTSIAMSNTLKQQELDAQTTLDICGDNYDS